MEVSIQISKNCDFFQINYYQINGQNSKMNKKIFKKCIFHFCQNWEADYKIFVKGYWKQLSMYKSKAENNCCRLNNIHSNFLKKVLCCQFYNMEM